MALPDNVPFIGPRSRYKVLGTQPTLLVHKMAAGALDGLRPETASLTPDNLDPAVSGGKALWDSLIHGGLFNFVGKAVKVDSLSTGTTWTIVEETTPNTYVVTRVTPTVFPFRLSPNEKLQATGGATASVVASVYVQQCI
jgi:hypothetical protein